MSVANASSEELSLLLDKAQPRLGNPIIVSRSALMAHNGLAGRQVEIDFTPQGLEHRYRRVHATLVDGKKLIHIIYTARDPNSDVVSIVMNSIRHEGAQQ